MNDRSSSLLVGASMAIVLAILAYFLIPRPSTGPTAPPPQGQEAPQASAPAADEATAAPPRAGPDRADPVAGLTSLLAQGAGSGEKPTARYATEKILSLEGEPLADYMEALVVDLLVTVEPELEPSRIETSCEPDGRRCTLTGPWPGDGFIRQWIQAIGYGEISHEDLEGVTFESFRKVEIDGSDHFSATVIAP